MSCYSIRFDCDCILLYSIIVYYLLVFSIPFYSITRILYSTLKFFLVVFVTLFPLWVARVLLVRNVLNMQFMGAFLWGDLDQDQ